MNKRFSVLLVLLLFFTVSYCNKTVVGHNQQHSRQPGQEPEEGPPQPYKCGKSHHHRGMKALHCTLSVGVLLLFVFGLRKCFQKVRRNRQNRMNLMNVSQNGFQQGQPILPNMQVPMQPIYPQAPVQQPIQQGYFTIPYEQYQQFQLFLEQQRLNSIQGNQQQIYGMNVQQPNIQVGIPQQQVRNPYAQI